MTTHFNTIELNGHAEFKEKGSRFLAFSFPVKDPLHVKQHIKILKKEHVKAVHFCFAYRLGIDGNKFRSSDDGEPAGSAGKPILGIIDSKEITDVLIVVVRYFGGTLLGIPGLILAYKSSAAMCLQIIPIVRKPILITYTLEFNYTQQHEINTLIKQTGCKIISQENQIFSVYKIGIPLERKEEICHHIKELRNVNIKIDM